MTEWSPQVIKLEKIERHPDADSLEISTVLGGYTVIFKEGRFKEGDLAAYVPADSICSNHPEFDWLGDKKRIKPIRLRGVFSLGILAAAPEGMVEGDSVVEHYGLQKHVYEEEVADQIQTDNESAPKGWTLSKYDLDGLRQRGHILVDGEECVITEKIEGSNFSATHDGERLWIKSRNWFKKENPLNQWWDLALRNNLKEKLAKYPNKAFYAECTGAVKGFPYNCKIVNKRVETKMLVFDILDIDTKKYLEWDEVKSICAELGLETVPELYRGPWKADKSLWSLAEGNSAIGNHIKEGFVVKTVPESYHLRYGRKVFKIKGESYCLKKK